MLRSAQRSVAQHSTLPGCSWCPLLLAASSEAPCIVQTTWSHLGFSETMYGTCFLQKETMEIAVTGYATSISKMVKELARGKQSQD